jgi:HTH-type transcriptional regulator, global nitrogen regulator NrpRI
MIQGTTTDTERKIIAILKVLSDSAGPLGSNTIAKKLESEGLILSERAVRNHLRITDERGYTQPAGHDGRMITPEGMEEVKEALALEQVGSVRDKLELLAFQTTFDPEKLTGQLSINTSLFDKSKFKKALTAMSPVFKAGLSVSEMVGVAAEGERLGGVTIPKGKIGFATVGSVVINGVLLKAGVPTEYRFGGVLEIKNMRPRRFVAVMEYAGSSVDPSEQFIRAKMTSVGEAARTGNGKILGVFRTIPSPARPLVEEKMVLLRKAKIGGLFAMGNNSEPIAQIPVGLNRVALVQFGGLNPVAAAVETGIDVENVAESGLIDYKELKDFWKIIESY